MNIEATIDLMLELDRLEALPRSGFLLRGVRNPESVAAHVYGTTLWAMLIADAIEGADALKAMRMALLHELGESKLTDVPIRGAKYLPKGAKEAGELSITEELLEPLAEQGTAYLGLYREYLAGESLEARIVAVADKVHMMMKVLSYERSGQRGLDEFWEVKKNFEEHGLPFIDDLFAELRARRPAGF